MAQTRRVYIIHHTHDLEELDLLSSMTKVSKKLDLEVSYQALISRLLRAKKRTGKKLIRLKDKEGNPITIEVRDIE